MKDQFVLIYWKDAAMHGTEQLRRKDALEKGLIKVISGGILVHEDKEQITLGTDWMHEYDEFRQINSIPKSGIYMLRRYYFGKRSTKSKVSKAKKKNTSGVKNKKKLGKGKLKE